jgi:hypothetical protein
METMSLGRVALIACALQGAACTPSTIAPQFARYSGCHVDKIEVQEKGAADLRYDNYSASGCGENATFRCLEMDRCKSPKIVVANRHAKQFSCSPKEAEVEELGGGAFLARGCGQEATYQCFDDTEHVIRCVTESTEINLNR